MQTYHDAAYVVSQEHLKKVKIEKLVKTFSLDTVSHFDDSKANIEESPN